MPQFFGKWIRTIEAAIKGACMFSSADGMTCRLPNVSYVENLEKFDFRASKTETEEFDMVKFAPIFLLVLQRISKNT